MGLFKGMRDPGDPNPKRCGAKPEIVCLCNCVTKDAIEASIRDGATTLNEIFDATSAGVGPCGGSCRRKLGPMLDTYLSCGVFPDKLPANCVADKRRRR